MISRRALLGTFIGAPLGCMFTRKAKPTTINGISRDRIIDVADMYLYQTLWGLYREGIRRSESPQPQGSDAIFIPILVPYSDFKQKMSYIIDNDFAGTYYGIAKMLKEVENGKATFCGVQCWAMEAGPWWAPEGGIVYQIMVVQTTEKPDKEPPSIYTQWDHIIK